MTIAIDKPNAHPTWIKLAFVIGAHLPLAALIVWGSTHLGRAGIAPGGDPYAGIATLVGLLHISFGLVALALRASARFLGDTEEADDFRREGRALVLGGAALVAAGASMVLLSLSGPESAVSATAGLVGTLLLSAIAMILAGARLRQMDELNRALAKEANHLAFVWFSLVGGTWAILAHLGFVYAPTPLGWLTLIWSFSFVAGLVALARRGGFDPVTG